MELVTASDLLVTASVALLISFIVAKLVSLATTDTHVHDQPVGPVHRVEQRMTVQSPQRKTRTGFISPVHVTAIANLETEQNTRDATVVSDSNVAGEFPPTNSDVIDATVDSGSDVAGELPTTNSYVTDAKVDSGSNDAVELPPTNSEVTDAKVDSGSNVGVELLPISSDEVDTKVESDSNVVDDFLKEETVVKSDDSIERRNNEVVEEIIEEKSTEMLVSGEKKVDDDDDDDDEDDWEWEGIERSDVEKMFMEATEFVAEKGYIGNCDDDLEMELYGLHKVAMEGPCRESQPMALKLSARAKWNAWQKLGNMSPEVAMERYISLLSDKFPEWMKNTSAGIAEDKPTGSEVSESAATHSSSALSHQQIILTERELVQESGAPELIPHTESDSENNVKK